MRLELPPEPAALLWKCTLATALLCACLLVIAAAQLLNAASRRVFIGFALVKLVILLLLTWPSPDFLKVLLDFGISFTIVAGIAIRCGRLAPGFGRRLAAGIILFALGGSIQAFGLSPHPWFNHNDLFHLIQILANTCLFLAARRTPSTQPVPG
ncbi:MAG TPA: hypothetical protein VMS21_10640 [Methylomirabilota bacterium]|nr:hypothetical protein [Methylomirabilota bacterium]